MSANRRAKAPAKKQRPPTKGARGRTPKGAKARAKRGWRSRLRRGFVALLVLGLIGALAGLASFAYLYRIIDLPNPTPDFRTQTTAVYYADGESELGSFSTQNRESIPLSQMPQTLQDAVVAAENRSFWTDRGIDPRGILRAAFSNAQGDVQGASTISQQYIKILYLTQERTLQRKVKEAVLALKIQNQMTKRQILADYLNTIYFGRGAYGAEAAAEAFFNKPASRLNLRQSAVLASVINNPTRFDPANGKDNKAALKERYEYTISGMATMGTITEEQADKALKRLPAFPEIPAQSQNGGQRGHMLAMIRNELLQLGFTDTEIDGGGLRVTTTFTPEAMKAAADGVVGERPEGFKDKQLHVGAASVEVGTGKLRGFYGGQDFLQSQINWAVAGGMAGSTLKAFTVAAAIEAGFSLRDTFEGNSPIELGPNLDFENQGDTDYGSAISMVDATENSVNTAFIDMVDSMPDGPQKVIDMAEAMGLPGNEPGDFGIPRASVDFQPNVGVTLGTAQVSPINLANAYATIANGGVRMPVHVIESVDDADGNQRYVFEGKGQRAVSGDIAADTSYALQQVVTSGSGREALSLGRPAAGKTGTATNDLGQVSSAWFVGDTPQVATAVMYVRGKGRGQLDGWLPEFFGGSYPARTWTAIMSDLMEGLDVEEFPEPVFVDGDAPDEGHASAPPAPAPAPPKPTKKPTKKPEPTVEPSPEPTPTPTPTPTPSPTPPPSPTPTAPSPTPTPPATPPASPNAPATSPAARR